jgi:hypothetical protein
MHPEHQVLCPDLCPGNIVGINFERLLSFKNLLPCDFFYFKKYITEIN